MSLPDSPAFRMSSRRQSAKSSTNDMRPHGPSPWLEGGKAARRDALPRVTFVGDALDESASRVQSKSKGEIKTNSTTPVAIGPDGLLVPGEATHLSVIWLPIASCTVVARLTVCTGALSLGSQT